MNCDKFQELIALSLDSDWPGSSYRQTRRENQLETHLASCAACREFAADLRECQAAYRHYPGAGLTEEQLRGVRANVMQTIALDDIRPSFWTPFRVMITLGSFRPNRIMIAGIGLAAIAIILFAAVVGPLAFRGSQLTSLDVTPPGVPESGQLPFTVIQSKSSQKVIKWNPKRPARASRTLVAVATTQYPDFPDFSRFPGTSSELDSAIEATTETEVMDIKLPDTGTRVEIQTADPKIRIIWFLPRKPDALPTAVAAPPLEELF